MAVVNETLQHEIRMLGFVELLDRTCAKQYAQNLCVVGCSSLANRALEGSAASAVEGSPKNPTSVQIDQLAVQDFLGWRRYAVDLLWLTHREQQMARGLK